MANKNNKEKSINEWQEKGWNPVTGCTKCSPGCKNCYAVDQADWLVGMNNPRYKNGFNVTLHEDVIDEFYKNASKWKKSFLVFVNSMSDLFHEQVPTEFIKRCFKVMNALPLQKFLVLTKRTNRLLELAPELEWTDNIIMGTSVEDKGRLFRIDDLRKCGAKYTMLSVEPLIEDLGDEFNPTGITWVAVAGESIGNRSKSKGNSARIMDASWVRRIKAKCEECGSHFTFKQWGGYNRKLAGSVLDGKVWDDRPVEIFVNHTTSWVKRLRENKALISECDKFENFNICNWLDILPLGEEFEKIAKNYPAGCGALLCNKPELENELLELGMFERMSTASWLILVEKQPQFAKYCCEFKYFNNRDWQWLLEKRPEFMDEAKKHTNAWVWFIENDKNKIDECKILKKFNIDNWAYLIFKYPQMLEIAKNYVSETDFAILKKSI